MVAIVGKVEVGGQEVLWPEKQPTLGPCWAL